LVSHLCPNTPYDTVRPLVSSFIFMRPRPPSSTLFPYTTLFRSELGDRRVGLRAQLPAERGERVLRDVEPERLLLHPQQLVLLELDRKSTRLNSSHEWISYAVFCLKKKKTLNYLINNTNPESTIL